MTPTRIVLAAGAVAGVIGLSLGAATMVSAQTTPTTKPATTAPANGNCPNMGKPGSSTSSTGSGV